jgi:hypothetical protein
MVGKMESLYRTIDLKTICIIKDVSSSSGAGVVQIFSLVWVTIEIIFYTEYLMEITADIQGMAQFGPTNTSPTT